MSKSNGITIVFVVILEGDTFALSEFAQQQMRQKYNTEMDLVIFLNNYMTYDQWSIYSSMDECRVSLHPALPSEKVGISIVLHVL